MKNLLAFFNNLGLRNKLLFSYAFVFIISIAIAGYISHRYAISLIRRDIEKQLKEANRSITRLVKTASTVATRNYLRALVEKNIESLLFINNNSLLDDKKNIAAHSLANQIIGENGFFYCIDSDGKLVVTPKRFEDPDRYSTLPIQITQKEGYFEYRETDNYDLVNRPKADFSKIFEPWGWTIVASAFRNELIQLVQDNDFKSAILSHQFGEKGHSYVLNSDGNMIIHPYSQNQDSINQYDERKKLFLRKVNQQKNGQFIYHSRDAITKQAKNSLIVFSYLPEFDWIVASETDLEEFYLPLKVIRVLMISTVVILILLLLPINYWLSASIANPINELMNNFEAGIRGDLTIRTKRRSTDEIGLLANYFNSFMDKLENYSLSLQNEMIERTQLEREIMEISEKERYRIGQDLHDDLCPHLIGVEALCKVLVKKLSDKTLSESAQVETIQELIAESIIKTRNLSKGLCPVDLGDSALESSLSDISQHTKNVLGIDCKFVQIGSSVRFDQSKATNLYYIARESVLNAVKHSHATQITLTLDTSSPQISLTIEDNGKGFDEALQNRGIGLNIMKYRANVIGGHLQIVSKLNQGSKVICKLSDSKHSLNDGNSQNE